MVVLRDPLVASFDAWDGTTDLYAWRFSFNGGGTGGPTTASFDPYSDNSGSYALSMVSGAQNTPYAVKAANPAASRWGGGVRLLLHCFDASSYKGLTFWIRGSTPAGTIAVALGLGDKDASYQMTIPSQWQQMRIAFNSFSGWGTSKPGQGIVMISFSSQLRYVGSTAQPGAFEITVDEVGFY
jgi:hypothetical protein